MTHSFKTSRKPRQHVLNFSTLFFTLFAIFLGKCEFDGVLSRPNQEPEIIKEYSTSPKLQKKKKQLETM